MQRVLRVLKWTAIGFAGLLAMAALLVVDQANALRRSLPQMAGVLTAPGLDAPAQIWRDRNGVPHIHAQSRDGALYALGVAHAQDRLWQMELTRRIVQGRLAEIFGSPALPVDIGARTLGLYAAAEAEVARAAPDVRTALEAYAAGVNAAMAAHKGPLPPEFAIFLHAPEPWRAADSVAVIKAMAVQLAGNAASEGGRALLAGRLSREQIAQFFAPGRGDPEWPLPDLAYLKTAAALQPLYAALGFDGPRGASNNWAVAGARTAGGKPLLANDPHLGLTIPSVWYLAHLSWPDGEALGGSLPGFPAVIAGRNAAAAFGLTTTGADVMDLVIERLDETGTRTVAPDGPQDIRTRTETIAVRFGFDRTVSIRESVNGPLLPLEQLGAADAVPPGHAVALRWSGGRPGQTSAAAIAMLTTATWDGLRAAMRDYAAPVQSFVFASEAGEIGLIAPGFIPVRAEGYAGQVPARGWEAGDRWTGLIAFDELPQIANPESGAVFSANGNILPPGYERLITADWEAPYRRDRVAELLSDRIGLTREDMAAMQNDIVCLYAMEVLPLLAATPAADPRADRALTMLAAWDRRMAADRPEPLIFAAWMRALSRAVYADELGDRFETYWSYRPNFMRRVISGEDGFAAWCDDIATEATETCAERQSKALQAALKELTAAYGDDMAGWRWGTAHPAVQSHRPLGFVPWLGSLFGVETPMEGGAFTLSRADHRFAGRRPYAGVHGAGLKFVVDWNAPDRSLWIVSTGQSGNPYSPHYRDLAELWAAGGYLTMTSDWAEIEAQTVARLALQPSGAASPR